MKTIHSYLLLITAFAICLLVRAASAQTATWNVATGNWSNGLNWNPPVDPNTSSFDVIFNNGGSLTLDMSRNIGSYSQTGGTLTVVSGQSLVVWNGGGTLAGGGVINLGYSYIYQGNIGNVAFTNTSGTIQGYGEIGFSGVLSVLNQPAGVIQANVPGQTLKLNGSGTFTNNGLIRAQNGGALILDGSAGATFINNATIRSEGFNVSIQDCTLFGGTLDNTGFNGFITLTRGTLRDVTIASGSTVTDGVDGRIENTLINHGTLADQNGTTLLVASDTTLSGGGAIALGFGYLQNSGSNRTLTNTDNVLRGYGEIGRFGLNVINGPAGIIQADVSGQTLKLSGNGSSTLTNNGLIRAQNGGHLILDGAAGGTFINNATIRSEDGFNVSIQDCTLFGGTLDNTGFTGAITLTRGTLRDVTIAAGSTVTDGVDGRLENTLINHGTLADQNGTTLLVASDTTLSGGGVIALGLGYLQNSGSNRTLTNTDNVLRGYGEIGRFGLSVINGPAGIVQADVLGQSLKLSGNGSSTFTNNGLIRAQNGGLLIVDGSAGGTFTNNGTIDLDGGSINFPGGFDLNAGQLIGNGTFIGSIRNNGGKVGPGHSPGKITVNGDYTQGANGTLDIEIGGAAPGTEYDQLQVSGIAALSGTLNVSLINGFRPAVGAVFQFILPGSFTGAFSTVNTTGFTGQVNYSAAAITITILTVSGTPTPTPTPQATPSKLLNISTRLRVQTGDNALIGGFIITGTAPKRVIIRGIGPSLSAFFSGALANPTLELYQGSSLLAMNDNWKTDQQAEIEATGIPPTHDFESAIVRTLTPGAYTAILRGKDNTTGIGVVEAYDLDLAVNSRLANISTRGFVETGDNVMIGGLIIGPANGPSVTVVVRAIGPSLSNFGISGALQDPTLDLVNSNGVVIRSNNDWRDSQQAAIIATGLQPSDDHESALVQIVPPGNYTAIMRGVGNTTGVGLVEVYSLQ